VEIKEIISSGLLDIYAMGMASEEEARRVQEWMQRYPEIADELREIELSMEAYAFAHSVTPASHLKSKILRSVEGGNTIMQPAPDATGKSKVIGISPVWKWVAAASILLFIGSSIFNAVYYNKYIQTNTAYEASKQELLAQNKKLDDMDRDMSVVTNKYSLPVALNGLPAAPDAAAKIFWMKNTGEVYIDPSNLPEAPTGKQYQLWAIVDGKPVDGGMILTTKKGNNYHIQKMKTFGRAEAFAVTLEKEGGNPTPQGEMYVMGKM